jgi:hypothetical protein
MCCYDKILVNVAVYVILQRIIYKYNKNIIKNIILQGKL